ncbi:hypothetical protein CL630_00150 [bacterium]|nr:hypothetical protein [bacterium]
MKYSTRIRFLYIFVILFALVFASKLFFLQIIHGSDFSERASQQYISPVARMFDRGIIFFTNKDGNLFSGATLKTSYTIAINPTHLKDAQNVFKQLSLIYPTLDSDSFFLKAGKILDPYEEIAREVPEKIAFAVQDLGLAGVSIYQTKQRFYPGEKQAAHVLGFVGYEGDQLKGRYGLERYYEDILERNAEEQINLFAEAFANIKNSLFYRNAAQAGDLVLTIEPEVQSFLEHTLEDIIDMWDAKSGGALIINPQNGELYALVGRPTFNPNRFSEEENYSIFSNPIVENVFEMGSIVKPLTMAVGLDAGVIASEDTYYDAGFVEIDSAVIENYDGKARGKVDMQEILNQSLNTGAIHIAKKLGNKEFADYLFSFGFGDETGIDLPNETSGLVENLKSNRDIEFATASFGQGFAVTPIAMARALSALANGGVLPTPHVVQKINYEAGFYKNLYIDEIARKRVISEEASEEITRMLVRVVDDALLDGTVKMPRYSVAAKTGTAQIAKSDGKGYYDDRFFHSFFGYFPAYDPQFLLFFYVVEPKGARFASQTLTHPFIDTVTFLKHYYEIPPDR